MAKIKIISSFESAKMQNRITVNSNKTEMNYVCRASSEFDSVCRASPCEEDPGSVSRSWTFFRFVGNQIINLRQNSLKFIRLKKNTFQLLMKIGLDFGSGIGVHFFFFFRTCVHIIFILLRIFLVVCIVHNNITVH